MSSSQGILFLRVENGESKWFEDGDEENDGKYVGEIENGKPNGTGTITLPDGRKYVGEWREGKPWNITIYGKSGIIILKYVNGVEQE